MTTNDTEGITTLHKLFYLPIFNDLNTPKKKEGGKKTGKKKLEENSVFITVMNMTENNLITLLELYSVNERELRPTQLTYLLEKDWIRASTTAGSYFITAKGIWEVESKLESISPEKVVDYLDKKKFRLKSGDPLNDEEKVVLFTFIALRSYSSEIQIHRDKTNPDILVQIFDECADLLKKTRSIKEIYKRKDEKSGEDPITYILRRTGGSLPKKTRNIFQIAQRANYLKIYDRNTETASIENLSYLLWKIFGGDLTLDQEAEIRDFCNKQFNNHMNDIYPLEMQDAFLEFTKSEYMALIPDSLVYIQEQKQNWEMTG